MADRVDWPFETGTPTDYLLEIVSDRAIDLGGGHYAQLFVHAAVDPTDDPKPYAGFFHVHPSRGGADVPAGHPCAGSVTFDIPVNAGHPGAKWQLVSLDPLHVEPSILCSCGRHGYVRAGRWEDCDA